MKDKKNERAIEKAVVQGEKSKKDRVRMRTKRQKKNR